MFWKKLTCSGFPCIFRSIKFFNIIIDQINFYLHNKHIIIKLKSLKILCHFPVFLYMHTITCSFQAEKLKKDILLLICFFQQFWGGRGRGQDSNSVQANFSLQEGNFLLTWFGKIFEEVVGLFFFYYKFLRNQGRKRCKTNVNFQLYIVSCRMEQFMKKGSISFAAAQYCGRKKLIFDCEHLLLKVLVITFFSNLCNFWGQICLCFFYFFAIFFKCIEVFFK